MVWCPTGPTSLRLKILENGKTHKQSPRGKGSKLGWKLAKKGNRGIVLTDVPRSRLDLPLHSAALAPRLSYPLIVGNLLLAGGNTKMQKCKNTQKHVFHQLLSNIFCPVNVYKYFVAVPNSRPRYYLKWYRSSKIARDCIDCLLSLHTIDHH